MPGNDVRHRRLLLPVLGSNRTITTGQGGLIATDDDLLHRRLRELKDQGRPVRGTGGDDTHNTIGYNFKFTNLQAAVGLAQLKDLTRRLGKMRSIYRGYADGLRGVPGISILPCSIDKGEVLQWTDVLVTCRDELFDYLTARGIHGRRFWHPLHYAESLSNDRPTNSRRPVRSRFRTRCGFLRH